MDRHFIPPNIITRDECNSNTINEAFYAIRDDIRRVEREIHQARRRQAVINDLIAVYDTVLSDYVNRDYTGDDIFVTSDSVVYPTSIGENEKCNIDPYYNLAMLNIVQEIDQLRKDVNTIRDDVTIRVDSNNNKFLATADRILVYSLQGEESNVLTGTTPFLCRFEGDIAKASTIVNINRDDNAIKCNTININMFPTVGNTELERIQIFESGVNTIPIYNIDGTIIDFDTVSKQRRMQPLSIGIKDTIFGSIEFSLISEKDINNIQAKMIGINKIDVLYREYSNISYIGFMIDKESLEDDVILYSLEVLLNEYSSDSGISWFVYNTEEGFNSVDDSYISYDINPVPFRINTDLYILIKLEQVNNSSPMIKGIRLDLR